jgi:serine protease Do
MIRKSLAFVLLGAAAVMAAAGQTPEPQPQTRAFSMVFGGDGGYLGVETADVTKDNLGKYGLREARGVGVEKVVENSPAAAAGLQAGDVIVKFNGEEITSVRKLTRLIGEVAPDHRVSLTVLRGGSERELTATLGKRATPKFENGAFGYGFPTPPGRVELPDMPDFQFPVTPGEPMRRFPVPPGSEGDTFVWRTGASRQIGVSVSPLTKQLAEYFGVQEGVLVNNVRENSPAAKAGLKAGDVITEIDGKAVKGDIDLIRGISEKKEGEVALTVIRDRSRQTIRVTPEAVKGGAGNFFDFPQSNEPGGFKLVAPKAPATPTAPTPFELFFPGRVL